MKMKKLFTVLAIAATFTACNDTETAPSAISETDSLRAAAVEDSLAAIKTQDSIARATDSTTVKIDSAATSTKTDSIKK